MNLSIHMILISNNFIYVIDHHVTLEFFGSTIVSTQLLPDTCRAILVKESLSVVSRPASSLWNFLHNLVEYLCQRDSVVRDLFVEAGYELSVFHTSEIQLLQTEIFPRKATIV